MKLKQRSERLYELTMGYVKAFLIAADDELVLIDTGTPGKGAQILEVIDRAGLDSKKLKHIIISHLHEDHTGSLAELVNLTSAAVYAHKNEADAIEQGIIMRKCTASPHFPGNVLVPLLLKKSNNKKLTGSKVDVRLNGDELLDIGGGIQIISTPGHTAGHICCLLPQEKILLAGDVGSGGIKPGYPLLFEDMKTGLESLKTLGSMDFNAAYFCHGKTILRNASRKFSEKF